jgi:hypothetical protein
MVSLHDGKTRGQIILRLMTDLVPTIAPLSGITVAEVPQLRPSVLQHDDVKLAVVCVRSPIPWDDDALYVRDGKETLVRVSLTVCRLHVLVEEELGEHALGLVQCPTPRLKAALIRDMLLQHEAMHWFG